MLAERGIVIIMMVGGISRLSANNAAFNWMNAANARMGLLSFAGNPTNLSMLAAADTNLELQMLNDSFKYKAYTAMADSEDKLRKENIKRSFSIFA